MSYRWQDRPQGLKAHCNIQQMSSKEEVVVVAQDGHGCVPGKVEKGLEMGENWTFSGIHNMMGLLTIFPSFWGTTWRKGGIGAISRPKVFQQSPIHVTLLHNAEFPQHLSGSCSTITQRAAWGTSGFFYSLWDPHNPLIWGTRSCFFLSLYLRCQWKPPPASKYGTSCRWNLA